MSASPASSLRLAPLFVAPALALQPQQTRAGAVLIDEDALYKGRRAA